MLAFIGTWPVFVDKMPLEILQMGEYGPDRPYANHTLFSGHDVVALEPLELDLPEMDLLENKEHQERPINDISTD